MRNTLQAQKRPAEQVARQGTQPLWQEDQPAYSLLSTGAQLRKVDSGTESSTLLIIEAPGKAVFASVE